MLGSSRTRSSQTRIVSATNADLPVLIREGRFREDLYYRLNVIEITVPPLAERSADVLPLALHFLGDGLTLSDDAAVALQAHDWPGNVRELRNSIERAKLLVRDKQVGAADLNLPECATQHRTRHRTIEPRSAGSDVARGGRQHQPCGAEPGTFAPGLVPAHGKVQFAADMSLSAKLALLITRRRWQRPPRAPGGQIFR